jgi:hypothetical protein
MGQSRHFSRRQTASGIPLEAAGRTWKGRINHLIRRASNEGGMSGFWQFSD